MKKPELLLPAGSVDALKTAVLYGADAVYAGLPALSLRTANGFTADELKNAVRFVHDAGKKIYLTLNLFSKNDDVPKLEQFAETAAELKPDALIISDAGVFDFMKQKVPEIPLHVSTQANVSSWLTVDFWKKQGAAACVLARETCFADIREIKRRCEGVRVEMFVHGAMCMSYSGRCLLSAFMANRSANQGKCAQSCRWEYDVFLREKKRPDDLIQVEEDGRGTYFMNSKDLCLMPRLNEILDAGIDILKIEGRNKTPYYVAVTAKTYRQAIDDWFANPDAWSAQTYMPALEALQNRGYCQGFFDGFSPDMQNYSSTQSVGTHKNAGVLRAWEPNGAVFEIFQKIKAGDTLFFLAPNRRERIKVAVKRVVDAFDKKDVPELSPGKKGQAIFLPRACFNGADEKTLPVLSVAQIQSFS